MAEAILQVKESHTATINGGAVYFRAGELVSADHPAVKKNPQLFCPVTIQHPWRNEKPAVEQATAAPGEKRGK